MKVVVAMDSLKGSLTSMEAGNAVKKGILRAMPETEVIVKPLADGGEGTVDALMEGENGTRVTLSVTGPIGGRIECYYGILEDGRTAVMEMAQAAGITLVAENQRNVMQASTYGVGEMICDAVHRGCRHFVMGIGGSATNDGGILFAAKIAKRYDCQVLAFAGEVTEEAEKCNEAGIDTFFPIVRGVTSLEDAMKPENAEQNMTAAVEQVFRLISLFQ